MSLKDSMIHYASTKTHTGSGIQIENTNCMEIVNSVVSDYSDTNDVPVNNLKVQNRAIHLLKTSNAEMIGVIVSSSHILNALNTGICIQDAKNTTIMHSIIQNFNQGIHATEAKDVSIIDSTVNNSLFGIIITDFIRVRVHGANLHRSTLISLYIHNCSGVIVTDTHIEDTYVLFGIHLFNSRNTLIDNALISCSNTSISEANISISSHAPFDSYCLPVNGIFVNHSTNTSISRVDINLAHTAGIEVLFSSFTIITNINVTSILEGDGISISNSADTDISRIIIEDVLNGKCVLLYNTTNTILNTSYLRNCHWQGVNTYQGTNISVISTFVSDSPVGILIENTRQNLVDMVQVSSAYYGISVGFSAQITLRRMKLNTTDGVSIWFSNHVLISNMTANSREAGKVLLSANSSQLSMKDCIVNLAVANVVIDNSNYTNITNLTSSSTYTNFDVFLSAYIFIQNIHTKQDSYAKNVRLTFAYAAEVILSNILLIGISNSSSGQRAGGLLYISQSNNIVMSNISFTGYTDRICYAHNFCFSEADAVFFSTATIDTRILRSVAYLHSSTNVVFNDCSFASNNVTALKSVDSSFTLSGTVNFTNNRAIRGAAIILSQKSYMTITDNAVVIFKENTARLTGGAIYLDGYRDHIDDFYGYSYTTDDIVSVDHQRLDDNNHTARELNNSIYIYHQLRITAIWFRNEEKYTRCFLQMNSSQVTLAFVNNTAAWGGDVLYGGNLAWECISQNSTCDESCLSLFKYASTITPQHSLSQISSDPSRVCLCSSQNTPDCSVVSKTLSAYPGQTISIQAVVVGQDFGIVRGSVYAQIPELSYNEVIPQLEVGQAIQDVSRDNCNQLDYTILSKSIQVQETQLVLTASFQNEYYHVTDEQVRQAFEDYNSKPYPVVFSSNSHELHSFLQNKGKTQFSDQILHFPVLLNITLLQCPPGFMLKSVTAKCDCNKLLQQISGILCNIDAYTIERSGPVWIGTVDINFTDADVVIAKYCPFNFCSSETILLSINSSQTDDQCNYNHSGVLCGGCKPGLSLAVGSSKCLQCSNTYLSLLLPFAVAGIALVLLIKTLNFTVSCGTINGLVFYANIVKANEPTIFPHQESNNILTVFISWINLDLGVETCFVDGFTAYWKMWMQFVFPLYVWTIAGCIIISAKYSRRVVKVMGNNSVPVLATLFLLSYAKLLRSVITILQYSVLEYSSGKKLVWSADGNLDYLGPQHIPLFAAAVAALLFLWLPYTLLLFSGQWIHKCNFRLISRSMMKIKPLLDAYYGPLEDNHRYWFGALLLMRAVILLVSALVPSSSSNITMLTISTCSAILVVVVNQKVYRNAITALSETLFLLNLILLTQARLFSISSGGNQTLAAHLLVGVAFLQFVLLVLLAAYNRFRETRVCVAVRACVQREQEADDDMELFQLADADREVDMDSVSTDSSDSQHSLPTY